MSIKLPELATLKAAGLLFAIGCFTTAIPLHQFVTSWWQQTHGSAPKSDAAKSSVSVQLQQQQRQRHLREACLSYNDTWTDPGRTFVLSHDLRILFCVVGKAACTSWLRVLLQLTGNPAAQLVAGTDRSSVHGMFRFYLEPVSFKNSTPFARSPLKDYLKFMFVREPLERLVSAFRDKMFRAHEYVRTRQYIVGRFRRHPSFRSLKTGDDVKFEEFVQYVLQEAHHGQRQLDHHWKPQYDLCQPCHVNYDFVGHYETIRHDAQHILRNISRLGGANITGVRFPATDLDSRNRNSHEFLRNFYGNVSTHNIVRLLQLYKRDYEAFGYKIPAEIRRLLSIQSELVS